MVNASRYERELVNYLSQFGLVARIAASGTLNTIVGDLVLFPEKSIDTRPWIIEVKSTHSTIYYPSKGYRNIRILADLADVFGYRPVLAVRFIGAGWVLVDLSKGIPRKVDVSQAEQFHVSRKTLDDWLKERNL